MTKDLSKFLTLEAMQSYCRHELGAPVTKGREEVYPCPYGSHTRAKLTVFERDKSGMSWCHACGAGGNIFLLAEQVSGISRSSNFKELLAHVSSVTKLPLDNNHFFSAPPTKKTMPKSPKIEIPTPIFLSPADEDVLFSWYNSSRANTALLRQFSLWLGISDNILKIYTNPKLPGSIVFTPDNRLAYVYSAYDSVLGRLRPTGLKVRGEQGMGYPKLCDGVWTSSGLMPADLRFIFAAGKIYMPWGMPLNSSAVYLITEGETDRLALCDSLASLAKTQDIRGKFCPVSLSGTNGLPDNFLPFFTNKNCVLIADGDEAGQRAAAKNIAKLKTFANFATIYSPPAGYKDIRDFHRACGSKKGLIINILKNTMPQ